MVTVGWRVACTVFVTIGAQAQDVSWDELVRKGAVFENAGDYSAAVQVYRSAETIAGQSRDHRLLHTLKALASSEANLADIGTLAAHTAARSPWPRSSPGARAPSTH